jgi:hypothetical protein
MVLLSPSMKMLPHFEAIGSGTAPNGSMLTPQLPLGDDALLSGSPASWKLFIRGTSLWSHIAGGTSVGGNRINMKKLAASRIGEDVPALLEASTVGVPAVPDPDTSAFSAPPVEGLRLSAALKRLSSW